MSTELKLTLNAEAYYAELEKVIQTAKQSSARIKDSADVRNAGMEDFAKGAKTAAESTAKIGVSAKAAGKDIKNITVPAKGLFSSFREGIKGVTEELRDGAGASKEFAGRLKGIFSPLGLLVSGLAAVGAYALACWEKLSGGAEAAAARAEKAAEKAAEARQKEEERIAKAQEYMNNLVTLSTAEGDVASKMALSKTIIAELSSEYGNLGIQVDSATGKISGLAEAMNLMAEKQGKSRINLAEKELNALQEAAYKQADVALTEMMPGATELASVGIDIVPDDVRDGTLKIMKESSLEERLKFARGMYNQTTNKEDLENWGKVVDTLEEAIKKQKELNDLRKNGGMSSEEYIQKTLQAQQAAAAALARKDQQLFDAELNGGDTERGFYSAEEEKDHDLRKTRISKEIQRLEEKYRELLEKTHSANMEAAKFERGTLERTQADTRARELSLEKGEALAALRAKQKELFDLEEQRLLAQKKMVEEAKYELEYNDLLAKGEYQKVEALKLEKELKSQNLVLSQREKDEILAARAALKEQASEKRISDAREETALQRLLVQGRYEEYQIMKMELEAKRAGRELTEKERDAVLEQVRARKSLDLTQSLQNRAGSLAEKLAGQSGQGEAYAVQKALRDAERSKGFALTDDERSLTERLAKMEFSLANPGRGSIDTLKGAEIQSNDLTARGGFASGAVVPEKDRIAQAIEGHTKSIRDKMAEVVNLQNSIKQLIGT